MADTVLPEPDSPTKRGGASGFDLKRNVLRAHDPAFGRVKEHVEAPYIEQRHAALLLRLGAQAAR